MREARAREAGVPLRVKFPISVASRSGSDVDGKTLPNGRAESPSRRILGAPMSEDKVIERLRARVGTTIDAKYKLEALLGLGGMAAVYSATHRNGDRVALKVLHAELSRLDSIRERFLREGYVANKIGHTGVVRVIDDAVAPDGCVYLVMELLEGQTLEQHRLQAGGTLALPEALSLVGDILDILAAAHTQQIVHRDIKPDNVFLTSRGLASSTSPTPRRWNTRSSVAASRSASAPTTSTR